MSEIIYTEDEVIIATDDIADLTAYQVRNAINKLFDEIDKKLQKKIKQTYPSVVEIEREHLKNMSKELHRLRIVLQSEMTW